jgi:hypothetical protein
VEARSHPAPRRTRQRRLTHQIGSPVRDDDRPRLLIHRQLRSGRNDTIDTRVELSLDVGRVVGEAIAEEIRRAELTLAELSPRRQNLVD